MGTLERGRRWIEQRLLQSGLLSRAARLHRTRAARILLPPAQGPEVLSGVVALGARRQALHQERIQRVDLTFVTETGEGGCSMTQRGASAGQHLSAQLVRPYDVEGAAQGSEAHLFVPRFEVPGGPIELAKEMSLNLVLDPALIEEGAVTIYAPSSLPAEDLLAIIVAGQGLGLEYVVQGANLYVGEVNWIDANVPK